MAAIRCQACGKPNPDFLEVCQYCEARLKPLETGAAPDAAAPPPGDLIRCQACGKPNPNFLEVCQFCESPLKPQTFGAGEAAPAGDQIRCQSCGRLNPPSAEICQYCEARLHPLQAIQSDETAGAAWPAEPGSAPPEPEWMWTGSPSGGAEPALSQRDASRSAVEGPALSAVEGAEPTAEETPDWMKSFSGEQPSEAANPDWLSALGGDQGQPAQAEAAAPAEEIPDWLRSAPKAGAEPAAEPPPAPPAPSAGDIPDWLRAPTETETAAPASGVEPALSQRDASRSAVEGAAPFSAEEVPDWMGSSGSAPTQPEEPPFALGVSPAPSTEMPDWMISLGGAPPELVEGPPAEAAPAFGAEPAAEIPDWLSSLGGAPPELVEGPPAKAAPAFSAEPAAEMPDWLTSLGGAPAPLAETETVPPEAGPDWLSGLSAPAEAAPPFGAFTEAPSEAAPGEMPDWLSAQRLQPAAPTEIPSAPVAPEPTPPPLGAMPSPRVIPSAAGPALSQRDASRSAVEGLAQGELPAWLQSMRPVDVQPSHVPPEVDNYEEKVGILAGMRGVLQAEPSIAKPHKSEVEVQKLIVSEVEAAQAVLLAEVLKAEAEETRPVAKRRLRISLPVERWLVFAALAAAVITPWFFAAGFFPAPTTIARETNAVFTLVEALPADEPALIAFDYEPAQRGELDPAAQAVIFHLMRRGVSLVGVSTHPAGAGVGDDNFGEWALAFKNAYGISYTYGVNYLNLGYIPGGPVGLLQFAMNPRLLFNADFSGAVRVWDPANAPALATVQSLDDFGLIVLISATPDSFRAWIEQTRSFAAETPVVAVVSAGADPLVRPYYEASPPQINGLVSGIVGAAQYEQQAGLPQDNPASARWDAIGGGMLAAIVLILAGNLLGGLRSLLRGRKG